MTSPIPPAEPARLVEELARRNDELAALDAIGKLAARSPELHAFLDEAARIVEETTRCACQGIYGVDELGGTLVLIHQRGAPAGLAARVERVPIAAPAVLAVAQSTADVVSTAIYPARYQAIFEALGVTTLARIPLVVGSRIVGIIAIGFPDPDRERIGRALQFLRAAGAVIGAVISGDRLLGSLRRRVSDLTLINDLAVASAELDPGVLIVGALRPIADAFGAEMGAAFLREGAILVNTVAFGLRPEAVTAARAIRFGTGPVGAAVARRQVVTYADPEEAGGVFAENMRGEGIHAVAGVPLLAKDEAVGGFVLGRRSEAPFSDEDCRLLQTLGTQLGVAVQNSRLYAEARRVGLENAGLAVDLDRSQAELVQAQAQLLQRERLAALGALSAAVAHEVRNPLGVIFNAVGMLRRHRSLDEQGRALVDMVGEEAERLNRIVTDLLGFARPSAPALRPEPLGPIVEEAVRAALAGNRAPIETSFDLAPDLPAVAVDAGLVRQAVINVALNAAQAMPRGGKLRIRTSSSGGHATVEVNDTGPGIPDALRERVFEPFYTTKTSGTGLGLAIVKHVVEVHGGGVDVSPAPGGGTRLSLRFPLAPAASLPPRR